METTAVKEISAVLPLVIPSSTKFNWRDRVPPYIYSENYLMMQ